MIVLDGGDRGATVRGGVGARPAPAAVAEAPSVPYPKDEGMGANAATDWENPTSSAAPVDARGDLPGLLDLGRAFAVVKAEWRRIAAAAVVGTALAAGAWAAWPTRWTAVALVMVDPRNAKVTNLDEVLPGIGGDSAAIASIAEIATSDGALGPLVIAENLGADPEFAGRSSNPGDIVAALRKAIRVTRRGLTYVIEIAATAKEADKAARLANMVAQDIVDRQSATRINATESASGALSGRLADLRAAALASERAVSDYRMSHGLLDVGPDSTVGQRRLASLTQQAATTRGRLEEAKAKYDELKRLKPQDFGAGNAPRSDLLATLRNQLSEERRQAAELTRIYGERHPRVQASQDRLAEIENQIRVETGRLVDQARAEIESLTKQTAALESDIAKRSNAELALNQDEVVLRDLIRQAEADRHLYEEFLSRQKSTREQSSLTRPDTEVVSKALPPSRSNRPSLALFVPVGFLAGLLAGLGLAFTRRRPQGVGEPEATVREPAEPVAIAAPDVDRPDAPRLDTAVAVRPEPFDGAAAGTLAAAASIEPGEADPETVASDPSVPLDPALAAPARRSLRRRGTRPEPRRIFEELGAPVVADLPRLAVVDQTPDGDGEERRPVEIDLAVVDARPAMMPFVETFFPHLKSNPGQALMVTNVPGAVGRTTMALAIGRMAESVGLTALVVTDHGDARDLRPSLVDLMDGRHDLSRLPPAETVDRVSVMGFGGRGGDGFWDVADDRRLPALMARLTREFDLVVVESAAPEAENREVVPSAEAFRSVLLVADRARNTMADVSANAALWAGDGERLVMVGLNAA